jgi:hypothetical protein
MLSVLGGIHAIAAMNCTLNWFGCCRGARQL